MSTDTSYANMAATGGGCLVGCTGVTSLLALVLAPTALCISGIVLNVLHFTAIPDCASHYRAWCIVMTILTFGAAKTAYHDMEGAGKALVEGNLCSTVVMTGILCIPAAVGYAKVVDATPGGCDLAPMAALHAWTWCVIGYFAAYAGVVLLAGLVFACLCKNENRARVEV